VPAWIPVPLLGKHPDVRVTSRTLRNWARDYRASGNSRRNPIGRGREWELRPGQLVGDTGKTAAELYREVTEAALPATAAELPEEVVKADGEVESIHQATDADRRAIYAKDLFIAEVKRQERVCANQKDAIDAAWAGPAGERMQAAGCTKPSDATYRRWKNHKHNPASPKYAPRDGRRYRGAFAEPGSERFREELLAVYVRYQCAPRTFQPAYETAAGMALQRGETPPSADRASAWLKRRISQVERDYVHQGDRKFIRTRVESVRRNRALLYRPGAWASSDWHKMDFLAMAPGKPLRPWLGIMQDVPTMFIRSFIVATRADADALCELKCDDTIAHGATEHDIIDNGKDYRDRRYSAGFKVELKPGQAAPSGLRLSEDQIARVEAAFGELGTNPHHSWPFNPGSKSPENWFAGFCNRVAKAMPTYVGNRPDARPADLYADLKADRIDVPTLDEVRAIVAADIEAWNDHPMDSLGGRTPREAFGENPVSKRTLPAHQVRFICMPRRVLKLGRGGTVSLDGVKYGEDSPIVAPELFRRQGEPFMVRFDSDRSRVFVCELDGRLICELRSARLEGVSAADVKELKARQKAARRIVRQSTDAAKLAARPLDSVAMVEARHRYYREQTKGRKVAGAGNARPLSLIQSEAADSAPSPKEPTRSERRKDAASALDRYNPADLLTPEAWPGFVDCFAPEAG
jgi:hypothetical protein